MKLDRHMLLRALELREDEIPAAVIVEGSWWQQQRNRLRLARLERVRELPFPEMHHGYYHDRPVVYSCVYGAPRAVEPVHVFASLGSSLAVNIGSCGAIQRAVHTGDAVLPTEARTGEGASQYYAAAEWATPTPAWVDRAAAALRDRGLTTHRGRFITTSALFAQPDDRVREWERAGYLGVDMETSAVFTAARALDMHAVSMLFAWDELHRHRTFLDEYTPDERERQEHANLAIYDAALELAARAEVNA